jgi:hypothetical protein
MSSLGPTYLGVLPPFLANALPPIGGVHMKLPRTSRYACAEPQATEGSALLQPGCNHGEPSLIGWGWGGGCPLGRHTRNSTTHGLRVARLCGCATLGGIPPPPYLLTRPE